MGEEQAVQPLAIESELGAPSWNPSSPPRTPPLLSEQGKEEVVSLVQWNVACRVKVWEAVALKDLKLVGVRVCVWRGVGCVCTAEEELGRDLASAIHLLFIWPLLPGLGWCQGRMEDSLFTPWQ